MITITNISKVIDNSGTTPVEVVSNPVQTVIVQNPVVKETRYCYDLCCPNICRCHNCCPFCGNCGRNDNCRANREIFFGSLCDWW